MRLVARDAHERAAIRTCPGDLDGRFPTRHETLVRVHRWIRDEREFGCILQKPCDVVLRDLREVIAIGVVLVEEDIVAVLVEQALMNMHARARLVSHGLRHERGIVAILHSDLFDR